MAKHKEEKMMAADNKTVTDNKWEKRLLIIAVVMPIVISLIIAGVPVIWKALTTIAKTTVPNIWVFLLYLYIAFIAFLVGRMTKK